MILLIIVTDYACITRISVILEINCAKYLVLLKFSLGKTVKKINKGHKLLKFFKKLISQEGIILN